MRANTVRGCKPARTRVSDATVGIIDFRTLSATSTTTRSDMTLMAIAINDVIDWRLELLSLDVLSYGFCDRFEPSIALQQQVEVE